MSWTDERIETLKSMWEAGQTASQIAEALGGVSRNAVIGKAHRLQLQARPSPVKPNEPEAKAVPAPVDAPAVAPAPESPPEPEPVTPEVEAAPERDREPGARLRAGTRRRAGRRRADAQARYAAAADPCARWVRAASSARARANRHRPARPHHRGGWCPPSLRPRWRARRVCSISTTAFANGRWVTRASPISTSVATR